jgi:hypothetical protein
MVLINPREYSSWNFESEISFAMLISDAITYTRFQDDIFSRYFLDYKTMHNTFFV